MQIDYAYAGDDPVDFSDPTGKCPWCVVGAAIGVIGNGLNNYQAYNNGTITGWQYFEDIAVGAGTGYLSGIPGGGLLLGALTAGSNEGIQELINGKVNLCKIALATGVGGAGSLLTPIGEGFGDSISRPVIGSLVTSPNGYPAEGATIGFIISSALSATPIPDYVFPGK